jgi:hypothetical protein
LIFTDSFTGTVFAKIYITITAPRIDITVASEAVTASAKKILILRVPVAILLFIERKEISDPVNMVQKTAEPKGMTKTSFLMHVITNKLSKYLGLAKKYILKSEQVLLTIAIPITTEKPRTSKNSLVLKNLNKDDFKEDIMRYLPSLQRDS